MSRTIVAAIVPLLVGFILTGVIGTYISTRLQRASWQRQDAVSAARSTREQRLKAFEDVSVLLDKRLYAMRLLWWSIRRTRDSNSDGVKSARAGYSSALIEWNNNLNRVLALMQVHFGANKRESMEALQEQYVELGRALDILIQAFKRSPESAEIDLPPLGGRLSRLGDRVYHFNVGLLNVIEMNEKSELPQPQQEEDLGLGMSNRRVKALQSRLRRQGFPNLYADGIFGWGTHAAVCKFQRSSGLPVDGHVGPHTVRALDGQSSKA